MVCSRKFYREAQRSMNINVIKRHKWLLTIILAIVGSRFLMFIVFLLSKEFLDLSKGFSMEMARWDCAWYEGIIREGYYKEPMAHTRMDAANWAFFPLFSMIMRGVSLLFPNVHLYILGEWVNTLIFGVALYAGVKYILLTRDNEKQALLWILVMSFGPLSFYFLILYTEALFLLLLILCFYYLEKENFLAVGLCGALLSASRNIGVMFIFAVLVYCLCCFFQQKEQRFMPYVVSQLARPRLFLGICMIPLGLFSYMFYLHRLTGDSLAFMRIQRAWGRDIENPVKVLFSNLKAALAGNAGITFILIWCVAAVVLLLYLLSRRHYVEFAIGSVFYWICLSAGIQSMQRYIIGSFVFVLSMTDELLEMRRMNRYIVLGVLFFLELCLVYQWLAMWEYIV